jgi:hypothetical protein
VTNVRHRVRARRKWKDGEPDAMRRAALVTWRPRGVRELWRMRKRLLAWGARGSLCSVRPPKRTSGKLASWPHKNESASAPCRVWMEKKQKAVQAQSAKTEIEKTRQFCRCCFLCVRSAPVSKRVPKLCFSDCKK